MPCEYCKGIERHDDRCPLYDDDIYCPNCHRKIKVGQKYVENIIGEIIHYDCFVEMPENKKINYLCGEIDIMKD